MYNQLQPQTCFDFLEKHLLRCQQISDITLPPKSTRKPGQFDRHLHDRLRFRRVAKLPGILQDLLDNADHTSWSYTGDLPPPNAIFPSLKRLERASREYRQDIHKEIDAQLAYEFAVAEFCATVAATLEFQLSQGSPNFLEWSTTRLSTKAIPGVRRDQALADGFLNMSDKGSQKHLAHPTDRERLILQTFPVIAIWEFKNLNFDITDGQVDLRAEIFYEMVNGFLECVFSWGECEKGSDCAIVHWKIGTNACPMGNNDVLSSCESYDNARKVALPPPSEPPTGYESGAKHSARDILQQAWTEALVHDATFLVNNAGNVEIIGGGIESLKHSICPMPSSSAMLIELTSSYIPAYMFLRFVMPKAVQKAFHGKKYRTRGT
ncbi:hypothetical protein H2248_010370 [Termitomyces sp. 'cryptogamus']|nr:hypothetical protein H2248_010370 [Termitomyces sp. 'cryptogamus']